MYICVVKCIIVKLNKLRNVFLMWPKGKQRDGGPVTSFQSCFSIFGNLSRHDDLVFQLWRQLLTNMTHLRTYFVFGVSPLVLILVWWGPTTCSCGKSARSSSCIFWVRRSGGEKFPKNVHFSWSWSWLEKWPKFCSKHLKTAWLVKFWLSQYRSRNQRKKRCFAHCLHLTPNNYDKYYQ